jgi:hypothetical protein
MIHYQTWPPQAILVSDWPIFKILLLLIHYQTWPPQAILVSDWPIFKILLL